MNKATIMELIKSDLIRYGVHDYKSLSFMSKKELYGYAYSRTLRLTQYYKEKKSVLFFFY